ncbi:MAG: CopG family transcriptional regulator [Gammaproteobacteria bacterium]|nr:CopG family transcriptional regulator [Gammaproteobacteria bacterium]
MKKQKKVTYTNESLGKVKIISDFLPSPDDLVLKEESVKITLSLSKSSVDFFKHLAEQKHTQYQKMIRTLLDKYASHFKP